MQLDMRRIAGMDGDAVGLQAGAFYSKVLTKLMTSYPH